MAKIKAHPRVVNPKKNKPRPRRRPTKNQHMIAARSSSAKKGFSSSASESESTSVDETPSKIHNQMDVLGLMGGSSSEKCTKQRGRGRPRRTIVAASSAGGHPSPQLRHQQPFSVLMGPNVNDHQWVTSRRQQNQKLVRSRPKKVVGDLLAGSLLASVSLDDKSDDDNRTKPAMASLIQQQRRQPTKANRGLPSVLVGVAADDHDDNDDEHLGGALVQKPKSQGHVLRRAYAAVGKEMRRSNKRSGRNTQPQACGLISMFGLPKAKAKDRLPTRSGRPLKTRRGQVKEEKHGTAARRTKPILSVLEAAVAEEQNTDQDRKLDRGQTKTVATKRSMSSKEKNANMKGSSSSFMESENQWNSLTMLGNELNTSSEHSSRTTNDAKNLSMLSLGSISPHVDETMTPMCMDFGPSSSPVQISDQIDLLECLDRCHIDNTNYDLSRKRVEEASPEMKVLQKRRDQKKTPGKETTDPSMAFNPTSSSSCVPDGAQPAMRKEKSANIVTKDQKTTHGFFADLEESLSELSDDEFFAGLEHQCVTSLPNQDHDEHGADALESFGYDKPAGRSSVCSSLQPSNNVKSNFEGSTSKSQAEAETGTARFSCDSDLAGRSAVKSDVCFNSPYIKDPSSSCYGKSVRQPSVRSPLQPSDKVMSPIDGTSLTSRAPAETGNAMFAGDSDLADRSIATLCLTMQGLSNSLTDESDQNGIVDAAGLTELSLLKNDLTVPNRHIFEDTHSRLEIETEKLNNGSSRNESSCKAPPPSPMLIDSEPQAKVLQAASEVKAADAFAARRSRRQRIATDRFTIAEHTAGPYYFAPRQSLKVSKENSIHPNNKIEINPRCNENCNKQRAHKYVDDSSDGNSSEILFCDGPASSDHVSPKDNSPSFEKSLMFSSNASTLQQRQSRRERKQTDFFHHLGPVNLTERNRKSPADAELVDNGIKSMDVSIQQDCSPQSASFNANLRLGRDRKQTAFYHNECTFNEAIDGDESETEASDDERSMSVERDAVQLVTTLSSRKGPRRVRRLPGRKPLLVIRNSRNSSLSDNDWSSEEMAQLSAAMATVDPTTELFWYSVACLVRNRTESECRAKWFSVAKTPIPKLSKKAVLENKEMVCGGDEDDIFNSSPLRGFLQSDIGKSENRDTAVLLSHYFGSAIKAKGETSKGTVEMVTAKPAPFRPKAGYKTYLQNLRRDVSRAEKTGPARKVASKTSGPSAISESVYEADVDVNIRLSPGGTLKIKSQYEDDGNDDFWGDDYDAEAEDE